MPDDAAARDERGGGRGAARTAGAPRSSPRAIAWPGPAAPPRPLPHLSQLRDDLPLRRRVPQASGYRPRRDRAACAGSGGCPGQQLLPKKNICKLNFLRSKLLKKVNFIKMVNG